jgi:hypothetical protein
MWSRTSDKVGVTTTFGDHPHSAIIQVSTGEADGSKHHIPCTFEGITGKRMVLECPERLNISTPISVEYNDAMFLGEVIGCRRGNEDTWQMVVNVEQILTGLESLMALRAGLLGEQQNVPQAAPVSSESIPINRFKSSNLN